LPTAASTSIIMIAALILAANIPVQNQLTTPPSLLTPNMLKVKCTWITTIGASAHQITCTLLTHALLDPILQALEQAHTEFWASELEMEVQATLVIPLSSPFISILA